MNTHQIGFDRKLKQDEYSDNTIFSLAKTEDFIKYGLEPEFIGRLPIRVACHKLNKNSLFKILSESEESILNQYKSSFAAYGIKINFTKDGMQALAEKAFKEKTGARGLLTVCESVLREFKYELPSLAIDRFDVDKNLVEDPIRVLQEIIRNLPNIDSQVIKDVHKFTKEFYQSYQMHLDFTQEALEFIETQSKLNKLSSFDFCKTKLNGYEHGLTLAKQNNSADKYIISKEMLIQPREALEKIVKDSYQKNRDSNLDPLSQ